MPDERNRRLIVGLCAAAGAAILWVIFHAVFANLSVSENAVGYVDPATQGGIYFGYAVMIVGIVSLAAIAAWSFFQYLRLLVRRDR